jgi:tripartite-type tricarboxylate transporter receptor subunit TctC
MKCIPATLALLTSVLLSGAVLAQSAAPSSTPYPNRPVRIVVPYSSGGTGDTLSRMVAVRLSEALKQPVLIDNRPGADGRIGTQYVASASPDGHTLLSILTTHTISGALMKLPYDPISDFAPVAGMAVAELGMGVHPSVPATNLKEFIAWGRSLPQPVNYATTQIGGNQHLAGELFTLITGVKMMPIPYKGGGDAMAAVMGGHVHLYFGSMASMTPVFRSGKVRPIAVTGTARDPEFPNMQTFAEGGIPGMDIRLWYGLLMPAGAPAAAIERIARLTVDTVTTPDFRAALAKQGLNPMPMDAATFGKFIRGERTRYAEIVKRAKITIDP